VWRRFGRNFSINLLVSMVTAVLLLLQTALLTKSLSIEGYGLVLIVTNLFVFLEAFVGVNVSSVLFRFFRQFQQQEVGDSVQGLLLLCLALCFATGVLIFVGMFALSPWIAVRFYHDAALGALFRVYALSVLFSAFTNFCDPILRIHDRLLSLAIPRIAGRAVTVGVLAGYLAVSTSHRLEIVLAILAAGVVMQNLPPLAEALHLVRPYLATGRIWTSLKALAENRQQIVTTVWNVNLASYLKLVFSPGDIFVLGLVTSPAQVALYGLARQLIAPLATLQNNLQTAITPEITSLWAGKKPETMKRLAHRYMLWAFVASAFVLGGALLWGKPLISWLAKPGYVASLPIFQILLIVACMTLVTLVFYPVGLSLDLLKWLNFGHLINAMILAIVLVAVGLDALTMAYLQFIGTLVIDLVFCLPAEMRMRFLAQETLASD
jgi:O-antigen/teichoic acid export membrane protein